MVRIHLVWLTALVLLAPTVHANPLEKARSRLTQTGLTDASLVAYDSCENGVQETCLQASIMFCLDKQESIAKDTLSKVSPDFDRSQYTLEINLLNKALAAKGAICGATTEKLALLTAELSVVAKLMLSRIRPKQTLSADDMVLLQRICGDEKARKIGNAILFRLSAIETSRAVDQGIECSPPGTLSLLGLPRGHVGVISGPMSTRTRSAKTRLPAGKYTITVTGRLEFPSVDFQVKPAQEAKVTVAAALKIESPTPFVELSIGGHSLNEDEFTQYHFFAPGQRSFTGRTAVHKPVKTMVNLGPGEIKALRVQASELVLRDDVVRARANDTQRYLAWGAMATGAVAGIVGLVSLANGSAKSKEAADTYGSYKQAMTLPSANRDQSKTEGLDQEAASAKTLGAAATTVGIGLIGLGVYWLMKHPTLKTNTEKNQESAALIPFLTPDSAGLGFTTDW